MDKGQAEKTSRELFQKTGVDFSRYRHPELVEAIGNAVTFPLFFTRSLSRPVGLMLLLILIAIIITDSGYFKGFLAFPGIPLAVVNGLLLGLVLLIRRIRNDMKNVFVISSDLSLQALRDISAARAKMQRDAAGFPGLAEIFQGINAIVILPMVLQALNRKVPVFGRFIAGITERFFNVVNARLGSRILAKNDLRTPPAMATREEMAAWLQSAERGIHFARDGVSKIVDTVSRVVAFPFLLVFLMVFVVSSAIVVFGYTLMA